MRRLSLAGAALALALPASASANGPYEPNNNIVEAYGPLVGGQTYPAAIETSNDEDFYFFYATAQQQLDIAVTLTDCPTRTEQGYKCQNLFAHLLNTNGDQLSEVSIYAANTTEHIRYTTPAAAKYYLKVTGDSLGGNNYQFVITPASAITSTPQPVLKAAVTPAPHRHIHHHARRRRRHVQHRHRHS